MKKLDRTMRYTPRLILRPPAMEDFDAYFEIHSDPETNWFNPSGVPGRDKAGTALATYVADWVAPGFGYWAVASRDAPELILGFGGVRRKEFADGPALNLYFRFRPSAWGKGFASEVAAAAIEFAFNDLHEPRVLASTRKNNLSSRKALERAGFIQTGEIDDVAGEAPSLLFQIRAEDFVRDPGANAGG